jgi:hypothetical protein
MSGHIVGEILFYEVPVCGKCRGSEDEDEYVRTDDRLTAMSSVKIQCPTCGQELSESVLEEIDYNDFNEMGYLHGIETSLHQKLISMLPDPTASLGNRKSYLKNVPSNLSVQVWFDKVKSKFGNQDRLQLTYNKYNFHFAIAGWDVSKKSTGTNLTDLTCGKFDTNYYKLEIPVEKGEPFAIYTRVVVDNFQAPRSYAVVERIMSAVYSEPESPKKVEKKTPLRRAVAVNFSPPKVVASLTARTVKVASPRAVVRPVSPRAVATATARPSSPRAASPSRITAAPSPIAIPGRLGTVVRPPTARLTIVRPGASKK